MQAEDSAVAALRQGDAYWVGPFEDDITERGIRAAAWDVAENDGGYTADVIIADALRPSGTVSTNAQAGGMEQLLAAAVTAALEAIPCTCDPSPDPGIRHQMHCDTLVSSRSMSCALLAAARVAGTFDREQLGRVVRGVWVEWALEQPDPKASWVAGWDELDDGQREVDMRIGEALYQAGRFVRLSDRERIRSEAAAAERASIRREVDAAIAELDEADDKRGAAWLRTFAHVLLDVPHPSPPPASQPGAG